MGARAVGDPDTSLGMTKRAGLRCVGQVAPLTASAAGDAPGCGVAVFRRAALGWALVRNRCAEYIGEPGIGASGHRADPLRNVALAESDQSVVAMIRSWIAG
jgi:hypothetical protein